jgi:hypothetical protein
MQPDSRRFHARRPISPAGGRATEFDVTNTDTSTVPATTTARCAKQWRFQQHGPGYAITIPAGVYRPTPRARADRPGRRDHGSLYVNRPVTTNGAEYDETIIDAVE